MVLGVSLKAGAKGKEGTECKAGDWNVQDGIFILTMAVWLTEQDAGHHLSLSLSLSLFPCLFLF